jgi:hypothetical protein
MSIEYAWLMICQSCPVFLSFSSFFFLSSLFLLVNSVLLYTLWGRTDRQGVSFFFFLYSLIYIYMYIHMIEWCGYVNVHDCHETVQPIWLYLVFEFSPKATTNDFRSNVFNDHRNKKKKTHAHLHMTNWTDARRCFYNNNICTDLIITRIFMIKTECKFLVLLFFFKVTMLPFLFISFFRCFLLFRFRFQLFNILCEMG